MPIKQSSGYHDGPGETSGKIMSRQDGDRRAMLTSLSPSAGNTADKATRDGEKPRETPLNRGEIFIAGNTSLNTSFRERHGKNTRSLHSGKTRWPESRRYYLAK